MNNNTSINLYCERQSGVEVGGCVVLTRDKLKEHIMDIENGFCITGQVEDRFEIRLEWETEISLDGGYEFEVAKNAVSLDKADAIALKEELEEFIAKTV